jgi:hypothetical protein
MDVEPHDRAIKQIDGLNPSGPDLDLMKEPQAQQRQDGKKGERAFEYESHGGPDGQYRNQQHSTASGKPKGKGKFM